MPAEQVKVKLLRPLNGEEIGATVSYDRADAERLQTYGAVKILGGSPKAAPKPANKAAPRTRNQAARRTKNK